MIEKLFEISTGRSYLNQYNNKIILDFFGRSALINLQSIRTVTQQILSIDLENLLTSDDYTSDLQVIDFEGGNRCMVLTLSELLQLQELLSGTIVMLDLKNTIASALYQPQLA